MSVGTTKKPSHYRLSALLSRARQDGVSTQFFSGSTYPMYGSNGVKVPAHRVTQSMLDQLTHPTLTRDDES